MGQFWIITENKIDLFQKENKPKQWNVIVIVFGLYHVESWLAINCSLQKFPELVTPLQALI